jgi:tripartite-type tricarboxylate transporter receptor subunit TctC
VPEFDIGRQKHEDGSIKNINGEAAMSFGKPWRIMAAIGTVAAVFVAGTAFAQNYPTRQITFIVPFVAGGNSDFAVRGLQPAMAKALGQAVVVIDKGGASGALGAAEVALARPDGYTIGLIPLNPLVVQPLTQKLPYSIDSFKYVCHIYFAPYVVMVSQDSPLKTFADFVAAAKSKPNAISYGTVGPGSDPHLTGLALFKAIGAQGLHVPYNGGGALAPALLAHTISVVIEAPSVAISNGFRVLAVFADKRIPSIPDVPTVKEAGYDVIAFTPSAGIVAPAATPDAIISKLESACHVAGDSEQYQTITKRLGITGQFDTGANYHKMVLERMKQVVPVLQAAGFKRPG